VSSLLRCEDIAVSFGSREVLRSVDLEVRAGTVVAIAGRNGAGKTTLLRVASGVLKPERGKVLLEGTPIGDRSRREIARSIAVVPQDAPIDFPFRAFEVVLMGRSPHLGLFGFETPDDIERARRAMAQVGIEDLADRTIQELSGGERQLVMIARALTQDPRVLLLDEPTAHLDLAHRVAVLDLVRDFARGERSALVVSHDLSLTARACDELALLDAGSILASGPPAEILTPENLQTAFGVAADVVPGPDGSPLVVLGSGSRPGSRS
jgi:iron complex transport system ATP-binding protein